MDQVTQEQARGARTQSLFRDVNERVREINAAFGEVLPLSEWICECADDTCTQRMGLTQAEYELVRANPTRFAVLPSDEHFYSDIERLVEQNERYWVVEKFGVAGDLAAKIDPRRVGLRGRPRATTAEREREPREDAHDGV